jgi:gliding motility-associated-like protein
VAPRPVLIGIWRPVACPEARLAPLTLRFTVSSTSNFSPIPGLRWDFGDGTQSSEESPQHTYATPGTYQPTVQMSYNQGRCLVLTTLDVVEVQARKLVPNIITPNGDGLNETFQLGSDCPSRLQVYSRWGQKVFEAAAYQDDWNADGQPAGIYYYFVTYPDGRRVKGWVEVIK